MAQLNTILFSITDNGPTELYNKLLQAPKPNGATNNDITLLFNKYFEVWN